MRRLVYASILMLCVAASVTNAQVAKEFSEPREAASRSDRDWPTQTSLAVSG
jgi:hypothetical protein